MKKISYTDHLGLRLKIRKLPYDYPKIIYENPEQRFYDIAEGNFIAIKKLRYNKKIRSIMIAYEEKNGTIEIITIHPIKEEMITNRISRGRWVKHE